MILKRNNERKRAPNIRKKGFSALNIQTLPDLPPRFKYATVLDKCTYTAPIEEDLNEF